MKNNIRLSLFLYFVLFVLSMGTIYTHFLAHRSAILQTIMTLDLNKAEASENVLAYFDENFNSELPNLSYTAIPINALMSRYYRYQGDFNKALSLLDDSTAHNPYIKFTDIFNSSKLSFSQLIDKHHDHKPENKYFDVEIEYLNRTLEKC